MTVDGLVWDEHPPLRRPVLVAGFEGWNDAGDAASDAVAWLARRFGGRRFAWIDPEEHFDFQSTRPRVELADGVTRSIVWPTNECMAALVKGSEHDLVVLIGVEPNVRWRSFCRAVISVAVETRCELVVTLGALLADVPHTRPTSITGTATDPQLISRLGLQRSRYEGPTGIVGVLHDACREAGLASVSLWAPVPHYVAAPPNPVATLELVTRFGRLTGITMETRDLETAAEAWRERVSEVVAGDAEVTEYVRRLEDQLDAQRAEDDEHGPTVEPTVEGKLPSGDDLAAELEQYLREQHDDG
jgi:proteasome assembly chaperone (PAC2) family protein